MLSREVLTLLKIASKMMHFSGAAPLKWVQDIRGNDRLLMGRTKTYRFFIAPHFVVLASYNIFMWYRLAQAIVGSDKKSRKSSLLSVLQIVWNLLSYFMPLLVMMNNFMFWRDLPIFVNSMLECYESFKARFLQGVIGPGWKNGNERKLKTIAILGTGIALLNTVLINKYPERNYFFTSILNDPLQAPWILKLPLIIAQIWVWFSCWSHLYFYCFILLPYTYATVYLLSQMGYNVKMKCTTKPQMSHSLQHPLNFMKLYRRLQTLHSMCNFCFQSIFLPVHKCVIINIAIIGIYGSIRIPGPRAIIMTVAAFMCLLYLTLLFRQMGKVYENSLSTLHSWRGDGRKQVRKFVRSSQPIRFEVGSYYYVTKTTVIVIWYTVSNFTTTMLLSF